MLRLIIYSIPPLNWRLSAQKWVPSGFVKVLDNTINLNVPTEGAKVLVRRWFITKKRITDTIGNYSIGHMRGKVRYYINWERYHFSLRRGIVGQARTTGPRLRNQPWEVTLGNEQDKSTDENERNRYFATVFQAAFDYYYQPDIRNLSRPHQNAWYKVQMKIGLLPFEYRSLTLPQLTLFGLLPSIYILQGGASSEEMYATTIHELAHDAHYELPPLRKV